MIEIHATAKGFLPYLVRSIAGTLLAIDRGDIDQDMLTRALSTCNRSLANRLGQGIDSG